MNLVLLCSELKFLKLWLNQKRLALVVRALAVKGQSLLLRTWTLRPDNAVEPVHHQKRTKRGSHANCQWWRALVCKFSATITHTPGILNYLITRLILRQIVWSGDFYPGRSGGHVVPRWKSPDVMVSVSLGWKSPHRMVRVSLLFHCWCLDIVKIDKTPLIYSFKISIWGAWCTVWCGLGHQIPPVVTGLVLCETWKSIAVPRSSWLPNNCRKVFAHFGQVYLICLIFVNNLSILGKVD